MEICMSNRDWGHHAVHLGLATAILQNSIQDRVERLRAEKADRLEDAREDYYQSLRALEKAAGDQALKEEAFVRGIVYAGLMRDAGRERDFDEAVVAEDIQRALRLSQKTGERERAGALERLRELEAVLEAGLITEEEYEKKRAEILASI
jgi:hypothetical protein